MTNLATWLLGLSAIATLGCNDSSGTTEPANGAIRIAVSTSGSSIDLDPDGYSVIIDGTSATRAGVNGLVPIAPLPAGEHLVRLEGVAPNCSVNGTNPRSVNVVATRPGDDPTVVSFAVTCIANVGSLHVTAITSGPEADQDGYIVFVGVVASGGVPSNGDLDIKEVRGGDQEVMLASVSGNCVVEGANPRPVSVTFGATAEVSFTVRCGQGGNLQVTVTTAGVDRDPDGYALNLRRADEQFASDIKVQPNGTATFSGLLPTDYVLTVSDVLPNCDAVGPNPRRVAVEAARTTSISLNVTCATVEQLTFVLGTGTNSEIYLVKSNGTDLTRLTANSATDVNPAWSPDGSRIAFASDRDGNREIYVMNADGTNPVRLTNATGSDDSPTWSADGGRISFSSERSGNAEIYSMNADGTNPIRLTTVNAYNSDPRWSPDGRQITFMSTRGSAVGAGIWIMNADGSAQMQLTSNARGDYQPAWSPDGTRIAFSRGVSPTTGSRHIFIMNADGTGATDITRDFDYAAHPAWSPDGRKIAFEMEASYDFYYPNPSYIRVVGADGVVYSSPTDLADASNPAWRK